MKRLSYMLLFVLLASIAHAQQAKYVFFFIGDGMGINQVNATEMFLAEKEGRIGTVPLLFASFPVASFATSYSASSSVTDSAAGGTALATGTKTYNSAIGVDVDKNPLTSIAVRAKNSGKRVGIATSVSIDHATPASFYAHQPDRNYYYEIALDLVKADFDFYAGSGFLKPTKTFDGKDAPSIFPIFEEAGFTIARGLDDYKAKEADAKKMIFIQKEEADPANFNYAIDRQPGDLSLTEITESAISFLMKDNKKGFFLMVEGGRIDGGGHNNDAAVDFNEVVDLDNAIKVAYEFYKKHPKETLIVVSADHETGGLTLGNGQYALNFKMLAHQKQSREMLSKMIGELRREKKNVTWEEMKAFLSDKMGFWDEVPVTWEQEKKLRDAFETSFTRRRVVFVETLYARSEPLAAVATEVMNDIAMAGWTSGSHTGGYVPVFAVGAGADLFMGRMDNTDIPKRIVKAARYK